MIRVISETPFRTPVVYGAGFKEGDGWVELYQNCTVIPA